MSENMNELDFFLTSRLNHKSNTRTNAFFSGNTRVLTSVSHTTTPGVYTWTSIRSLVLDRIIPCKDKNNQVLVDTYDGDSQRVVQGSRVCIPRGVYTGGASEPGNTTKKEDSMDNHLQKLYEISVLQTSADLSVSQQQQEPRSAIYVSGNVKIKSCRHENPVCVNEVFASLHSNNNQEKNDDEEHGCDKTCITVNAMTNNYELSPLQYQILSGFLLGGSELSLRVCTEHTGEKRVFVHLTSVSDTADDCDTISEKTNDKKQARVCLKSKCFARDKRRACDENLPGVLFSLTTNQNMKRFFDLWYDTDSASSTKVFPLCIHMSHQLLATWYIESGRMVSHCSNSDTSGYYPLLDVSSFRVYDQQMIAKSLVELGFCLDTECTGENLPPVYKTYNDRVNDRAYIAIHNTDVFFETVKIYTPSSVAHRLLPEKYRGYYLDELWNSDVVHAYTRVCIREFDMMTTESCLYQEHFKHVYTLDLEKERKPCDNNNQSENNKGGCKQEATNDEKSIVIDKGIVCFLP